MKNEPIQQLGLSDPSLFLSYAKEDRVRVTEIYQLLKSEGFRPWIDSEELVAGQDWDSEIRNAIKRARLFLIFLSQRSISKTGYVQKELREALDIADTFPDGKVYIIPIRLDDCSVPDRLNRWQWIDVFTAIAYPRLIRSIEYHVERSEKPRAKQMPPSARPALESDRAFARSCTDLGRFAYCVMPDGRTAITDGRVMMFRTEIGAIVRQLMESKRLAFKAKLSAIRNLTPKLVDWSTRPVLREEDLSNYTSILVGPDELKVGVGKGYLEMIKGRYPKSRLYLTSPTSAIVIGDADERRLDAFLMPVLLTPKENEVVEKKG